MSGRLRAHLRGNLVAYVALFVALGGTSYAAGTKLLPANSVGTRQVINRSLLSKDFKAGQLPAGSLGPKGDPGPKGDAGSQGDRGPQGVSATKLWALVAQDGTLLHGSGVSSVSHAAGDDFYYVKFVQSIDHCAPVASFSSESPNEYSLYVGKIATAIKESVKDTVLVETSGNPPTPFPAPFSLAVFC